MRTFALKLRWLLAALLLAGLLALNLRLHRPSVADYRPPEIGADVLPQLRYLGRALREGAGERMQALFPEGYFFTHVLYGLAWVEVGRRASASAELRAQAPVEARWTLERLDSPAGRRPFPPQLEPPYGVFHAGWSGWMRGGVLLLQPPDGRDAAEVQRFRSDCAALAAAFEASPTPFLCAYPDQAWPVDSVVAQAALALHDHLFGPQFQRGRILWMSHAQEREDPATGLLPHRVDPRTGQPIESARGSSQSVISRFLAESSPAWGREQYALFRERFVGSFLGLPGIREHPHGVEGGGDVDSGPLIAGLSASASAVTIAGALMHGDTELADGIVHVGELLGLPYTWRGEKRYVFGQLPVGDAFFVWAKTTWPWVAQPQAGAWPGVVAWWWPLPIHLVSGLLAFFLIRAARRRT